MAWISLDTRSESGLADGELNYRHQTGYGEECIASWTYANGELTIVSDPLGIVPLYYYEDAKAFICSDQMIEIFDHGVSPIVDRVVLALNLRLSFCPADLTIFEGVKRMPPGAVLKKTRHGGSTIERYYTPPLRTSISRKAAVESYGALFEDSVARLTRDHESVSVPLSGGRDSRHILLACKALGKSVEAVTFKNYPPTGTDTDVAVELCRRATVHHDVLENPEYRYHESIVRTLPEINFETMQHGWIWALIPKLGTMGRAFLDGLAGDTLSNGLFYSAADDLMMQQGHVDRMVGEIMEKFRRPGRTTASLTNSDFGRLESILLLEHSRWRDWPSPQRAFTFFNRTRRCVAIAPWCVSRLSKMPVIFPYMERQVFDFLMGLDGAFFERKGFHDEAIALRYPSYSDVPYGTPLSSARLGYVSSVRNMIPYLNPVFYRFGLEADGWRKAVGFLKIITGSDFAIESWRFVRHDIAKAFATYSHKR